MPSLNHVQMKKMREQALKVVDWHLTECYNAVQVENHWEFSKKFSDGKLRRIQVRVGRGFPYTPPEVWLPEEPDCSTIWPHFEKNGQLCILPHTTPIRRDDPAGVLQVILEDAFELIEGSINNKKEADFEKGFLTHWSNSVTEGYKNIRCISLLNPSGNSRVISYWAKEYEVVVGENEEELERWLEHSGKEKSKKGKYEFSRGILLCLDKPLKPACYPNNGNDILKRIPNELFNSFQFSGKTPDNIFVLIGAPAENSYCYGGICLSKRQQAENGFRPGHIDPKNFVGRCSNNKSFARIAVARADCAWVNGRDQNSSQEALRNKKVAILGCGSVGGTVAKLLAQSGVGNLYLIDYDCMEWANVGRHILGAESVGKNKAEQLAQLIRRSYPHLGSIEAKGIYLHTNEAVELDFLLSCDLIISMMGDWNAESYLNDLQQQNENFPPILYGWTEAHALAGHAVLISRGSPCFACGFCGEMRPWFEVTQWDQEQQNIKIPTCGGSFTPYGPAQLIYTHGLIVNKALSALENSLSQSRHHLWIGQKERLEEAGGQWSEIFKKEYPSLDKGGCLVEREWPTSLEKCFACG